MGMNVKVVGKCGICGGRVVVPAVWLGVIPPTPTCEKCGAVVDDTAFLPTLPMKPKARRGVCPYCGCSGAHFCTRGQKPHPGYKLTRPGPSDPWGISGRTVFK
jgi:hypothetical protein